MDSGSTNGREDREWGLMGVNKTPGTYTPDTADTDQHWHSPSREPLVQNYSGKQCTIRLHAKHSCYKLLQSLLQSYFLCKTLSQINRDEQDAKHLHTSNPVQKLSLSLSSMNTLSTGRKQICIAGLVFTEGLQSHACG